jgi:clan AA aspartic protease (TIGR02281 family)
MKRTLTLLLLAACALIVCAQPKNPSYNYQRGVEAINNDNDEEGEKYLLAELDENPKNGYAYAWLSTIERNQDELGNAIAMLNKALLYLPKADKYYRAWSYSALATIYLQLEDTTTAIEHLNKAVKTEPQNGDWLGRRAYLYILCKQYDNALADCRKLINMQPGMVQGHLLTAEVYYEQEKYQEALDLYEYALSLAERSYIYSCMARVENQLHNYEQAADYIIQAFQMEHFEDDASDLISKRNPELLDELLPRIKIQVAKSPNSIEWKYYLLAIYREKNQYEDAINIVKEIKTLDADAYYDYILSDLYQRLGDFETALQFAQTACEADTADMSYQYDLIYVYGELNRFEDALQIASQIIAKNPDSRGAYATRADIYFNGQNYDQAIEDYSTVLAIKSTYHYARYRRGYSYLLSGDTIKAQKDFKRLLQDADGEIEQVYAMLHLGMTDQTRAKVDSILLADSIYHYERYNIACCYALLGETELAFATLEDELKDGYTQFNHIRRDPDFISLRGERLDSLLNIYENRVQERVRAFQATASDSTSQQRVVEVPFTAANGVTKVDCTINNLPLNFIFDTGASDVTLSQVEANFMFKNGYLSSKDVIGKQRYQTADGNISVGTTILLKEVQFAGLTLTDVRASVVKSQNAPLLLGQTVLQRLGKIEIDNARRVLKITTNQ